MAELEIRRQEPGAARLSVKRELLNIPRFIDLAQFVDDARTAGVPDNAHFAYNDDAYAHRHLIAWWPDA